MSPELERILARLIVSKRLAPKDRVAQCLQKAASSSREGRRLDLGRLLVEEGVIPREAYESLLEELRRGIQECVACGNRFFHTPGIAPEKAHCKKCGYVNEIIPEEMDTPPPEGPRDALTSPTSFLAMSGEGVQLAAAPSVDEVGLGLKRFGRYEILEVVAKGGMGVIFKARQDGAGRIVALKVLRGGPGAKEDHVRRFKREAESVANLRHPNIIGIHEFGQEGRQYYFSMDFIDGESMDRFLANPSLDLDEGLRIMEDIARAMAYAHSRGIIHRDLKPANIIIDRDGNPRITDFGLARNLSHQSALTQEGQLLGTPLYMSPEQVRGDTREIDHRSDLFAIGVILYQMLTGTFPFLGKNLVELRQKILYEEPVPPRSINPHVRRDIETVCLKALEKEKARRYASSEELAEDIARFRREEPVRARPATVYEVARQRLKRYRVFAASAAALGVLALAGAVYLLWWSHHRSQQQSLLAEENQWKRYATSVQALRAVAEEELSKGMGQAKEGREREAIPHVEAAVKKLEEMATLASKPGYEVPPERAQAYLREVGQEALLGDALSRLGAAHEAVGGEDSRLKALGYYHLVRSLRPKDRDVLLAIGRVQEARGRFSEALDAYGEALKLDPSRVDARLRLGDVKSRLSRHDEAIEELSSALKREPENAEALLLRGIAHYRRGDLNEALLDLQGALRRRGSDIRAFIYRGKVYAAMPGHAADAEEDLGRAVAMDLDNPQGPFHRALFYIGERQYALALIDLNYAIATDDSLFEAFLERGRVGYFLLEKETLRGDLVRVTRADGGGDPALLAEAHLLRGWLYRAGHEPERALESFAKAIERAPPRAVARPLVERARLLLDRGAPGDLAQAQSDCQRALQADRKYWPAHVALGLLELARNEPSRAIEHLGRALEQEPTSMEALAARAEAHHRMGQQDLEMRDYKAALPVREDPRDDAYYFFREGKKYQGYARKLGRPSDRDLALAYFERALIHNPRFARAHIERGLMQNDAGHAKLAFEAFTHAVHANRAAQDAYFHRGRLMREVEGLGTPEQALAEFDRAIELLNAPAAVWFARGTTHIALAKERPKDASLVARALADLDVVLTLQRNFAEAYAQRAWCHAQRGEKAAQEEDLRRYQELTRSPREAAQEHYRRALELSDKLKAAEAIRACDEALALDPLLAPAWNLRSLNRLQIYQTYEALADLARAIELDPRYINELYDRLHATATFMDFERALERASERGGGGGKQAGATFLEALVRVMRLEVGRGVPDDIPTAIYLFSRVLEEDPTNASAYTFRALLYQMRGEVRQAKDDCTTALRLDPETHFAHVIMAGCHAAERKPDSPGLAFAHLDKAKNLGFTAYERMRRDPYLQALKDDPRFQALLKGR